jgi:hypothetical protein
VDTQLVSAEMPMRTVFPVVADGTVMVTVGVSVELLFPELVCTMFPGPNVTAGSSTDALA